MINVTLGEVKPQSPKPFPKLMIAKDVKGFIVLFYNSTTGVCVTKSGHYDVGELYKSGSELFIDYNEPITIQNA